VQIANGNKTVVVPIWDVGPWNTSDNYWDPPEKREQWKDLPQCLPEAQAGYEKGYNKGQDQFGRQVKNPAGIDLSDGTWEALGMGDNDWVVVQFLWTGRREASNSSPTTATSTLTPVAPAVVIPSARGIPAGRFSVEISKVDRNKGRVRFGLVVTMTHSSSGQDSSNDVRVVIQDDHGNSYGGQRNLQISGPPGVIAALPTGFTFTSEVEVSMPTQAPIVSMTINEIKLRLSDIKPVTYTPEHNRQLTVELGKRISLSKFVSFEVQRPEGGVVGWNLPVRFFNTDYNTLSLAATAGYQATDGTVIWDFDEKSRPVKVDVPGLGETIHKPSLMSLSQALTNPDIAVILLCIDPSKSGCASFQIIRTSAADFGPMPERLVFSGARGIEVSSVDRKVSVVVGGGQNPILSRDGTKLTYSTGIYGRDTHLVAADGRPLSTTSGEGEDIARLLSLSPDGRTQVIADRGTSCGGDGLIYLANADGLNRRQLTKGSKPAWSPDGKKVAFVELMTPVTGGFCPSNHNLFIINADGSQKQLVAENVHEYTQPTWSPDGTKLIFGRKTSGPAPYSDMLVIDFMTDKISQLGIAIKMAERVSWAPALRLTKQGPVPITPTPTPTARSTPASTPTPTRMPALATTSVLPATAAGNPWPMYGHDAQLTGQSPYVGPQTGDIKWTYSLGHVSFATFVVGADGIIYVPGTVKVYQGTLTALYPDGRVKWVFEPSDVVGSNEVATKLGRLPEKSVRGAAIGHDRIYVTVMRELDNRSTVAEMYALDEQRNIKWSYTLGRMSGIITAPGIPMIGLDGTIYVPHQGELHAVRPDGTEKWRFPCGVTPSVGSDGTVYVSGCRALTALSSDGNLEWQYPLHNPYGLSSVDDTGTVYVVDINYGVHAFNRNGTLKWKNDQVARAGKPSLAPDGTLAILSDKGLAILSDNGSLRWTLGGIAYDGGRDSSGTGGGLSPAIGQDGTIYIGSGNSFYAITTEGELKWRTTVDSEIISSPAIGQDGTVYVGSKGGLLYAFGSGSPTPRERSQPVMVLDAAQPEANYGYWFDRRTVRWQEFKPVQASMSQIDLFIQKNGSPGNLRVALKDGRGSTLFQTTVAQDQAFPQEPLPPEEYLTVRNWVQVKIPRPIDLQRGASYFIYVWSDLDSANPKDRYSWLGQRDSQYSHGIADVEGLLKGFDFAFQTWANPPVLP
jgi:hypothetical protein